MTQQQHESKVTQTKYRWIKSVLTILIIILLAIVTVIPGALLTFTSGRRSSGSGACKNRCGWRSQVTGQECYGRSGTFFDASQEGGVAESIRTEVLNLSKAPGDFWVLQMAEDGYTVEKFVYREGDYTVWYTLEPKSYTVYYEDYMAGKEE